MSTKKREHDHSGHAACTSHLTATSPASLATQTRPNAIGQGPANKAAPGVLNDSDDERARTIRVRAYDLWERAVRPDNNAAQEGF